MTNEFIQATAYAIDRHGTICTYSVITEGAYNIDTGSTTNTKTDYIQKMYLKHIKASQFNYPNLIGRESAVFYILAYGLAFIPTAKDTITSGTKVFTVDSVQSHQAAGQIVLYRVVAAV